MSQGEYPQRYRRERKNTRIKGGQDSTFFISHYSTLETEHWLERRSAIAGTPRPPSNNNKGRRLRKGHKHINHSPTSISTLSTPHMYKIETLYAKYTKKILGILKIINCTYPKLKNDTYLAHYDIFNFLTEYLIL